MDDIDREAFIHAQPRSLRWRLLSRGGWLWLIRSPWTLIKWLSSPRFDILAPMLLFAIAAASVFNAILLVLDWGSRPRDFDFFARLAWSFAWPLPLSCAEMGLLFLTLRYVALSGAFFWNLPARFMARGPSARGPLGSLLWLGTQGPAHAMGRCRADMASIRAAFLLHALPDSASIARWEAKGLGATSERPKKKIRRSSRL